MPCTTDKNRILEKSGGDAKTSLSPAEVKSADLAQKPISFGHRVETSPVGSETARLGPLTPARRAAIWSELEASEEAYNRHDTATGREHGRRALALLRQAR